VASWFVCSACQIVSVIGCENVAPGVVTQSFLFQLPFSQAQLLNVTVTLVRLRALPANVISSPIVLNANASGP